MKKLNKQSGTTSGVKAFAKAIYAQTVVDKEYNDISKMFFIELNKTVEYDANNVIDVITKNYEKVYKITCVQTNSYHINNNGFTEVAIWLSKLPQNASFTLEILED